MSDLYYLAQEIRSVNQSNGWDLEPEDWNQEGIVPTKLALIHSEVSEALEAFRHGNRENFLEELADVVIRTLDLSEGLGMNIEQAVLSKIRKNTGRGYKHGGKRV